MWEKLFNSVPFQWQEGSTTSWRFGGALQVTSGHFRQSHKATHGLSWIHLRSPTDLLRISFSCHFSKTRSTVDRSPIPPILDKRAIEELLSGKCVCVWSTGGGGGLLSVLPCNQENRRFSSNPQSQRTACLPSHGEIFDGNSGLDSSRSPAWHVDGFPRLERCYLQVPIVSSHRRFLRFVLRDS